MTLYIASTNPGKLAEFQASAAAEGIAVFPLPGVAQMPAPIEDADTFMGNAELKAGAYSRMAADAGFADALVLADDSGLEVDALGGRPGVRSARFADDEGFHAASGATIDQRNNDCLLWKLSHDPSDERTGRYLCALALARAGEVVLRATGETEGEILSEPRGSGGFGYDPLFLIASLGLTMAEIPRADTWQVSHRGQAFRDLLRQLRHGAPLQR